MRKLLVCAAVSACALAPALSRATSSPPPWLMTVDGCDTTKRVVVGPNNDDWSAAVQATPVCRFSVVHPTITVDLCSDYAGVFVSRFGTANYLFQELRAAQHRDCRS
jgi:hypothetical protein